MITKIIMSKKMILLGIVLFLLCFFLLGTTKKEQEVTPLLSLEKEVSTNGSFDIKGAVQKPGIYEFIEGERIADAISKSGGFLEEADTMTINLSKKLEDEMVIIIYTKAEIESILEEEARTNKVEQTCICPKIENNACIRNPVTNKPADNQEHTDGAKLVSLNHGTKSDFESLTGIGSSKADAIIAYREEHGGFQSIEELLNVNGIGEKTFEKIKAYLTL